MEDSYHENRFEERSTDLHVIYQATISPKKTANMPVRLLIFEHRRDPVACIEIAAFLVRPDGSLLEAPHLFVSEHKMKVRMDRDDLSNRVDVSMKKLGRASGANNKAAVLPHLSEKEFYDQHSSEMISQYILSRFDVLNCRPNLDVFEITLKPLVMSERAVCPSGGSGNDSSDLLTGKPKKLLTVILWRGRRDSRKPSLNMISEGQSYSPLEARSPSYDKNLSNGTGTVRRSLSQNDHTGTGTSTITTGAAIAAAIAAVGDAGGSGGYYSGDETGGCTTDTSAGHGPGQGPGQGPGDKTPRTAVAPLVRRMSSSLRALSVSRLVGRLFSAGDKREGGAGGEQQQQYNNNSRKNKSNDNEFYGNDEDPHDHQDGDGANSSSSRPKPPPPLKGVTGVESPVAAVSIPSSSSSSSSSFEAQLRRMSRILTTKRPAHFHVFVGPDCVLHHPNTSNPVDENEDVDSVTIKGYIIDRPIVAARLACSSASSNTSPYFDHSSSKLHVVRGAHLGIKVRRAMSLVDFKIASAEATLNKQMMDMAAAAANVGGSLGGMATPTNPRNKADLYSASPYPSPSLQSRSFDSSTESGTNTNTGTGSGSPSFYLAGASILKRAAGGASVGSGGNHRNRRVTPCGTPVNERNDDYEDHHAAAVHTPTAATAAPATVVDNHHHQQQQLEQQHHNQQHGNHHHHNHHREDELLQKSKSSYSNIPPPSGHDSDRNDRYCDSKGVAAGGGGGDSASIFHDLPGVQELLTKLSYQGNMVTRASFTSWKIGASLAPTPRSIDATGTVRQGGGGGGGGAAIDAASLNDSLKVKRRSVAAVAGQSSSSPTAAVAVAVATATATAAGFVGDRNDVAARRKFRSNSMIS